MKSQILCKNKTGQKISKTYLPQWVDMYIPVLKLKLTPEECASSSESRRAKKKANLHSDWRSCGERGILHTHA